MASGRRKTLKVDTASQLRALRTPLRQEIVRAVIATGPCTVKELARELDRPPASLYYHLHELTRAGILRQCTNEQRGAGKRRAPSDRAAGPRDEASYDVVAQRIVIDRTKRSEAFVDALVDLQRATLRSAERELVAAVREAPPERESAALLRLSARLSPEAARKAIAMLQEVARHLERENDPDATASFSFTAALVRTDGQGRRD